MSVIRTVALMPTIIGAFWGQEVRNPGKVPTAVKALVNTGSEGKIKEIKRNKTKQCYLPCYSVEKQTNKQNGFL